MTDTSGRTPLSVLLSHLQPAGNAWHIDIPDDWLQGRAIYGGLSAALCLAAVDAAVDDLAPLRSAQVAFVGPAGPSVRIQPHILRQGKSMAFVAADMTSGDNAAARATFGFGTARESALAHADVAAPAVADARDGGLFFEDSEGRNLGPNFARHFDSARAAGATPASGAETPQFCAWLRHRDAAMRDSLTGLVALADALPPAAMACMHKPAPVSTITWQFDLLTERPVTEQGWWLCRSYAEQIADGYSAQHMTIWNSRREPVLVGRQAVAVFA
ncbi:thioesterase family protein [Salinisphaera sp. LB1]|uniref:thioesterase family protein n=1 Tax=Salinisphaera sp. LB1 TaxID=2183911 RepID=UPI000D70870A|nr:thioesterase family protein [Salinisphaera sp. LB1]AWN17877.1 TesB-like acyl-CoA thioesterase 1 [Salinisphaera sp. LB1]